MYEYRQCAACGADISHRKGRPKYCVECATAIRNRKQEAIPAKITLVLTMRGASDDELRRRNTVLQPIKSFTAQHAGDVAREYVVCPVCECTLNKYDRFCRFCGQRIRED